MRLDDKVDTIDDLAVNWMKDDDRISKDCAIAHESTPDKVTCSFQIGFARNF